MKLGLAFSGGKDSMACLLLNKDRLPEITVLWANTEKNFPEVIETIKKAKQFIPNFVEIKTNREQQNNFYGIPADVVPIDWTVIGQSVSGAKTIKVQSYLQCCNENLSAPLNKAAKQLGITHIITGQRSEDLHKSLPTEFDGLTFIRPIENWTKQQVLNFLEQHMELPEHFKFNHSSMDCYDCTAYTKETKDIVKFSKQKHPELHEKYIARKTQLDAALREAMEI